MPIKVQAISPFSTDGCSLFFEGVPQSPKAWLHCCIEHDKAYWQGRTYQDRITADNEFYQCIKKENYPFVAHIMKLGVRLGGTPF